MRFIPAHTGQTWGESVATGLGLGDVASAARWTKIAAIALTLAAFTWVGFQFAKSR